MKPQFIVQIQRLRSAQIRYSKLRKCANNIGLYLHLVFSKKRAASPQQDDLGLFGPPSGQGAGGGARTRDRKVPADLRADLLATVPPTPLLRLSVAIFIYCTAVIRLTLLQYSESPTSFFA
ncbi:hypothetical protein PoB_006038600 [Plakobranchus ocellatus]|uniref:Uncharacterized protein n=1 Tax=Plakobranchus ocellatus TaxID=259542 RepID=A0AAV4CPR8_9GAST|nr:hypothetical protein PoB_006038600 [Plakobranchus ocellatus]